MDAKQEKTALFWCHLLHPIIFKEKEGKEAWSYLKGLSQNAIEFPDGKLKKPSLSTLQRKLKQYSQNRIDGLLRKPRSDVGTIRSVSSELISKAIELKKDQIDRSDKMINFFLKQTYGQAIQKSTLYRHLKSAGATKLKMGIVKKKIRIRWTRDHTHDLWIGDFENGPYIIHNNEVVPTYLSLFIDCHSRDIIDGRYYLASHFEVLLDALLRAFSIHGLPLGVYLDNAKIYHAHQLKLACYDLEIALIHRTPGDPAPGGLVERMFATNQTQFEAEVRAGEMLTLDQLNHAFSAYLEVIYRSQVHSETNQTPKDRYQTGLTILRTAPMDKIMQFFMKKKIRTVNPVFCDVQVDCGFYQVDPALRGDRVCVRYDPFSSMEKVFLYDLKNPKLFLSEGKLYHRDHTPPLPPSQEKQKAKYNLLNILVQKHETQIKEQTQNGLDYRKIVSERKWPFLAFCNALSKLLGKKGGLSAFTTDELELLKKTFNSISALDEAMLMAAYNKAATKQLLSIILQLKILNQPKPIKE